MASASPPLVVVSSASSTTTASGAGTSENLANTPTSSGDVVVTGVIASCITATMGPDEVAAVFASDTMLTTYAGAVAASGITGEFLLRVKDVAAEIEVNTGDEIKDLLRKKFKFKASTLNGLHVADLVEKVVASAGIEAPRASTVPDEIRRGRVAEATAAALAAAAAASAVSQLEADAVTYALNAAVELDDA
ncbi:hypothetical protein M885DRAFT_575857, partial [Pelagophyceae sp. CCMP2097]